MPFREWWHPQRQRRPQPAEILEYGTDAGPMLQDIVRIVNTAAHCGRGDLVWLSYNGYKAK